jgi:hypothetical protein
MMAGGQYVVQQCAPVQCNEDSFKACTPTYLPVCVFCDHAVSEKDCTDKGKASRCSVENAVCETKHQWQNKNGVKILTFSRRCEKASACQTGWYPSPNFKGFQEPKKHDICHTTCDPPTCQKEAVRRVITMWIRIQITYVMQFSIKYSPAWWRFTSICTPYFHKCLKPIKGYQSCNIVSLRPGSTIVELEVSVSDEVNEQLVKMYAIAMTQAMLSTSQDLLIDGVPARMSLLNVFPTAAADIGAPTNETGGTNANITTWDMSYYCQDNNFNVCMNGGTCTNDQNGVVTCTCPPGYSGPYCNIAPAAGAKANVALFATIGVLLPIAVIILIILLVLLCRQRLRNERETIYKEAVHKYPVETSRTVFPHMSRATAFTPSYRSPLGNFLGAQGINPGPMPGPHYSRTAAMGGDWDPTDTSGLDTLHRNMIRGSQNTGDNIDGRLWRPVNMAQTEPQLYRNPAVQNPNLNPTRMYNAGPSSPFQFPAFNNSRFGWNAQ